MDDPTTPDTAPQPGEPEAPSFGLSGAPQEPPAEPPVRPSTEPPAEPVAEPPAEPEPAPAPPAESPVRPPEPAPADGSRDRMLGRGGCLTLVLAFIVAAFAGALAGFGGARFAATYAPLPSATSQQITVAGQTDEPVAAAAAAALPSVVNIDVSGTETATSDTTGLPQGHPDVPFSGQGSGVAYKPAPGGGTYIITNDHVVEGANDIVVTVPDGPQANGTVVGTDPETDIAVVKVPFTLPAIRRADSSKLVVGQMAVVIGSPYGLQHSVSAGVVSGLHRSLPDDYSSNNTGVYPLVDVIQTDAAINPGNSGGAVVDRQGRLIGISSAIYSDTGANAGIGFAIPTNTVIRIADDLISGGKAKHPYLGILGQTVDKSLQQEKNLPADQGALVVEVTKGTGAAAAGLKPGDLIVALDGKPIRSMADLILAVRQHNVGDRVKLALWRDGKKIDVDMTVGDKPSS